MQPPKLPAKFSQDPPPTETIASSSRPDVRPKTPSKRPPAKTPPVRSEPASPKKVKSAPSPKRAVEQMARTDAAVRGSAPVRAEVAKAPAETTEVVTPVSEHDEAPLVAVPGHRRLSGS